MGLAGEVVVKVGEVEGGASGLGAFVAQDATGALLCLIEIVDREDAERDGSLAAGVDNGHSLGRVHAHIVEVRRVAADNATYHDDAVRTTGALKRRRDVDEFHRARHAQGDNIVGFDTGLFQGVDGAVAQGVGDVGVPFRRDDMKPHTLCGGTGDAKFRSVGVENG